MRRGWLLVLPLLAACTHAPAPSTTTPSSSPPLHLTARAFSDLPGWSANRMDAALAAFARGCAVLLKKPDDTAMGSYAGTVADWRAPCAAAGGDARAFFEGRFTPYEISGPARFTGYYEPQIGGSRVAQGPFTAPVYGLPPDLVRADLSLFGSQWRGDHVSGRLEGHALKPYPDRAAIDAGGATGAPILLYADPIDLFFLQIQGSGRVMLADGGLLRLSYAGENGQPYTAIGRTLVAEGALALRDVSLASIRAWLTAHPDQARRVMETNKSYVFFQAAPLADPQSGPDGTLGVALAPLASMAVDARIHPLGAPVYVAATGADPVQALLVGADTGGAIRGAGRGDIFFGAGAAAEQRAGAMNAAGRMFVLLPNSVAARLGGDTVLPP